MEFRKVETSAEVWAVIRARHPDMVVFSSCSNPSSDPRFGSQPSMYTAYGFADQDYPTIAAKTVWDEDPDCDYKRINEKHTYWLCVAIEPQS